MKPATTTADRITEVLNNSIQAERMLKGNRDIKQAQSTRKKLQALINKHSPK